MKAITLLLDGLGDRSYDLLGGLTPLQYANTPNLDRLSKESQCGLMTPYKLGLSLGTDLAHFLLFGYDIGTYPGRAIVDAIGENHQLAGDQLVLRASFGAVIEDEGYFIKSRFTHELSDEEAVSLCNLLSFDLEGYTFKVHHSYDSHCLIIVSGQGLSSQISDTDPFYIDQYVMAVEAFETQCDRAIFTADLLNRYLRKAHGLLSRHPINKNRATKGKEVANILLSKWAGMYKPIEPFYKTNGMTGLLLGKSSLLKGLSSLIRLPYETYDSLEDGIRKALEAKADYVHLHTKDPDTAAHQKDPLKKVQAIETIDKVLAPLLGFEGLLIVTADHATPCGGQMIHSGETVPFMARGQYIRRDFVDKYDEVSCSRGSVFLTAGDFMPYIQNATDRGSLYHLRAGKKWRNYSLQHVNKL